MVRLSYPLQFCLGISSCLLSFGGMWSMISGAVVKGSVAGANFAVNEQLEAIENIHEDLTQTTTRLKSQPNVSKLKLKAIERELERTEAQIENTESKIEHDLVELVEPN